MRPRSSLTLLTVIAATLLPALPAFAHDVKPAGGTPTEDLIPAAIVGAVLVAAVGAFGWRHRTGRTQALRRAGDLAERILGLPAYAAIPALLVGGSLLIAVFGYYWDVATHIDNGRDAGPFANPSHWFIIVGLLGIALAGVLSLFLGVDDDEDGVSLTRQWRVPVGGILLSLCGVIALLGFPLDDVWHRIFGQDVTLWSPTHIQMVGGASLATLSLWLLVLEGRRSPRQPSRPPLFPHLTEVLLAGAFLIGASTLQAEFDYAVPQFRLVYQPLLIMLAAGIALVPARLRLGRGGAVLAVVVFWAIRGGLTLLVSGALGRTLLHAPLYLGAALAVEVVAGRLGTDRQISVGAWSGLLIGTVGLATEWVWTYVWMPIPWPVAMLGEAIAIGLPAALAGGLVGGFVARALVAPEVPRQPAPGWLAVGTAIVVAGLLAWPIPMTNLDGGAVTVTLTDAERAGPREVHATIRLHPADAADGAEYLNVTAWQGAEWRPGVTSFLDPLEKVDDGAYQTTRPIPVHGDWKALIRLHDDRVMAAAPIYMPEDPAIPAPEIPATDEFTREFVLGEELLLREARDAPTALTVVAYTVTLGIIVLWVAAIGWGVRHLRLRAERGQGGLHRTARESVLPQRVAGR